MGNNQSEQAQQKKGLTARKNVEKRIKKGTEPKTPAERGDTRPAAAEELTPAQASLPPELPQQLKRSPELPQQLKCSREFSSSVGQSLLCPFQPFNSTSPSQSSSSLVIKNTVISRPEPTSSSVSKIQNTCHEQQSQGPPPTLCDTSGSSNMAASPCARDSALPPVLPRQSAPNTTAEHVHQRSTAPNCSGKEASAMLVEEASPQPLLPVTVQLEKTDHALKVTNSPVTTTATLTASYTATPKVEVPSNIVATKLETTAKCTCDTGSKSLSEGDQCSGQPADVEHLHLNLLAQIDSRIEYVKKQEVLSKPQMQAAVRRALKGVPYQEAVKGMSPKVNPARRKGRRKQLTKKVRMSRPTNEQPSQLEHVQPAVSMPVPSQRNSTKAVTNALNCSRYSSSEGSFVARTRVKLRSKTKMATQTEEILHSANDVGRKEDAQILVHPEVSGGAQTQTPPITCTAHTNYKLVTEVSRRVDCVYTFGESNVEHFSQSFNYVYVPEFKEGPDPEFNQVARFSTPQPQSSFSSVIPNDSSSLVPSCVQSTTPAKVSEDVAPEDLMVFTDCTPSSENACVEQSPEVGQDTSEDPPSMCPQTAVKRKQISKTEEDTTAQTETVKEATTEEAPPSVVPPPSPEQPARPEGRWHPFTTELVCPRRAWCSHRGLPVLPPNVRRWFDVKQNYLCEPPWVTTATLAASLALRVRQENRDLYLWM